MKHSYSSSCSAILSRSMYDNFIFSQIITYLKKCCDVRHCICPSATRCITCSPRQATFSTNSRTELSSQLCTFWTIALCNCDRGRVLDLTQLGIERVSVRKVERANTFCLPDLLYYLSLSSRSSLESMMTTITQGLHNSTDCCQSIQNLHEY